MQCSITDVKYYIPESIDWNSVAVVGEHTTPTGPFADDHFLVIVLRSAEVFLCSSDKADHLLPPLEQAIGMKVEYGLCNITDYASRVIFPRTLAEHPLFDITRAEQGVLGMVKLILQFGIAHFSTDLTQEIKAYLKRLETR